MKRKSDSETTVEDQYWISSPCSEREFLSVAKIYARAIVDQFELEVNVSGLKWEVSHRAKRRAGALHHKDGEPKKIRLTWEYFEQEGWYATTDTIRHELIHAHLLNIGKDPGHGREFERLAKKLDTGIHCKTFSDPSWWVVCEDCDQRIPRYKRSKLVKNPERFKCGECGGEFSIIYND